MPELPEVQTTVNGLRKTIIGLKIVDVWSNYNSAYWKGSETIKDLEYFKHFKKQVLGHKVISIERRAKNILINLTGGLTILVHLKMTGHLLYGRYKFDTKNKKDPWQPLEPESLKDPYNRHVRFVVKFNNDRELALSDVRRFAKIIVADSELIHQSVHLDGIGPEPLEKDFTLARFSARLDLRPNGKIKQVLTDQAILAGIGNIYADESLWRAGIIPTKTAKKISSVMRKKLYVAIKETLSRGIDFGGDSTSDYRNVNGERGQFQEKHRAYQRTGEECSKSGCKGIIKRIIIGARSTHYCPVHQK